VFADFDFSVVAASLPYVREGMWFSLLLTLDGVVAGLLLGTALAVARVSAPRPVALAASWYVNYMRSIPLVMMILWLFLVTPLLIGRPIGTGLSAHLTFVVFEAAYFSEIVRAGIQSISSGQGMAGAALGMTRWQVMRLVVLPQAFRNMLPLILTQTIVIFQDTSLVYAIGAKDLLKAAEIAGKNYNRPVEMYLFSAVLYFVVCFALSAFVKRVQAKLAFVR
jgi:glutamate/aspartate transport system permease protein